MSSQQLQESDFNSRGSLIFLVVAIAAYLPLLLQPLPSLSVTRLLLILCLGGVYLVLGIYGWGLVEPSEGWLLHTLYFAGQLGLVLLILSLGGGLSTSLWLLALPLAGQSAYLSRWATAAVSVAVVAGLVLLARIQGATWENSLQLMAGLSAAVIFVLVFTEIAVREERARHEVERLATELQQANQQLRTYAAQVEELATTTERNRLAREIHDSLGHYLTVMNVQLGAAQAVFDSDPEKARDALQKAQRLAQEGLADVRRSVAALRAKPVGDRSLPDALSTLVEETGLAGIATSFSVQGTPRPVAAPAELTLYRAAQEGLTNARKHARPEEIAVTLAYEPAQIRLVVADDGRGTDGSAGGFGLLGLRERVELLGGEVAVESAPGQGFVLSVIVPG